VKRKRGSGMRRKTKKMEKTRATVLSDRSQDPED
jgi:hypothetical protein